MDDILVGRGVRRRPPTLFDLISGPAQTAQSALGAMGSAGKGAAQATVGLPGDIESLVRMITGGEQILPTTEKVGEFVNQYIRAPYPQYERLGEFTGLPVAGALNRPVNQLTNQAADALVRAITRNPQATAPAVLQETAMPFMQAVAPRTPGLLETPVKSNLGFYSALEQATVPLQNKGTGSQFLAQIEKTAGVKPEELKWTGLDEFLRSRQNVTKTEVQDYLNQNRVNLQEVRLGGATSPYPYRTANEWQGAIDRAEAAGNWDEAANINQAWEAAEGFGPAGSPKFSQYTLPGGENYREILLTLPQKSVTPIEGGKSVATEVFERTMTDKYGGNTFSSVYNRLDPNEIDKYEMLIREDRNSAKTESILRDKATNYRSSHYPDQPNILAHMRVNDRVVDGKKTLFIEEIQSDWHQAGRKKGYGPQTETEAYYITPDGSRVSLGFGKTQEEAAAAVDPGWKNLVDIKFDTQTKKFGEGVPDAPFKTSWHELTLKRAIQEASEKGYDQIAFTTGKTQAERYDLSKQVDEINVTARTSQISGEQIRTVALDTIDGQSIKLAVQSNGIVGDVSSPSTRNFIGQNLSEIVGKELAEKIMKEGSQTISGEGLRVGGKGMEGFYDQILPKTLEKLGKKFDAKVTKSRLNARGEDKLAIKLRENGYDPYDADLQQILSDNGGRQPRWLNDTDITALELGYTPSVQDTGVEVWKMDITPKMRESVLTKGQPLFAATPVLPAGLLGRDEEQ